jgi:hypothetical protein
MRANFLFQSVCFLIQWKLRALMMVLGATAGAVDFSVPVPSQSALASDVLETSLRTQTSEFLFFRRSDLSGAYSFAKLQPQTGAFDGAATVLPPSPFGNTKVLATRDGGFVRATIPHSFWTFGAQSTLMKYSANGELLATRTEFVNNASFDLIEAADGKIVLLLSYFGSRSPQTIYVDITAAQNLLSPRREFYELCPPDTLNVSCSLFAATAHEQATQASARSTLSLARSLSVSFEEKQWTMFRLNIERKVLRSIDLGRFASGQGLDFLVNPNGTLMRVFDGQGNVIEYRFFDIDDNELWRIATRRLPPTASFDFAQADATGVTVFSGGSRLLRVQKDGQLLWQIMQDRWYFRSVGIASDGAVVYSANLTSASRAVFWRWRRADGIEPMLPEGVRSLGIADGGGVFALVAKTQPIFSTEPDAQAQTLLRFNAQGVMQTQNPIANLTLVPDAIQIQTNPLGGVDLAATYANQNVAAISRVDASGQINEQFKLALRGQLRMASIDQLFLKTPENTLARIRSDGAVLWDRNLFPGLASFSLLALPENVAGIAAGTLRSVDAQGNMIDDLVLPASGTEFTCYRSDVNLTADQLRCLYRNRAGQSNPIEIYGIDAALRINLRHVLFRAGDFLNLATNGDVLLLESNAERTQLLRVAGQGQLRWRTELRWNAENVVPMTSGGAWAWLFDGERFVITHIDSTGISSVASDSRRPILGFTVLSDSSLLVAYSNRVERIQAINDGFRSTSKAINPARVFMSGLSSDGMRATWRERTVDGSNATLVSVFDWPAK